VNRVTADNGNSAAGSATHSLKFIRALTIQCTRAMTVPGGKAVANKISGYPAAAPLAPVKGAGNSAAAADKSQAEAATAAPSSAQTGDQVTLTDSARSLQRIAEAVANAPVVNAAKVATVKRAVQSGTYQIDAGRVAAKLLQFDGELP
jgi:negative regulator of flagellin synthesis FlgM